MKPVPDSLAKILKDFCHVEWYEVDELRAFANSSDLTPTQKLLVDEFKIQISEAIELEFITPKQYEEITADECMTTQEVTGKLKSIKARVLAPTEN